MSDIDLAERLRDFFERSYHDAQLPAECISCDGDRIWWNGTRHRSATGMVDGRPVTVARFRCPRVRCAKCRKSWALLPPGLLPGRHFDLSVGAAALAEYLFEPEPSLESAARTAGMSARTLGRFRDFVAGLVTPDLLDRLVGLVARAPILSRLLPVADPERKAKRDPSRRSVLDLAARVLCLTEALAAAAGLAAPGLSSLLTRIFAGRRRPALGRGESIPAEAWRRAAGVPETMAM
jgi:hypothetical protein